MSFISSYFFKKIVYVNNFFRKAILKNIKSLFFLNHINLVIVLVDLNSTEEQSVLNSFLALNFFSKGQRPFIKKLYVNRSKKYLFVIKTTLRSKNMIYFFEYFLKSYLKMSYADKMLSFKKFLNFDQKTFIFFIKNFQMFSEISENFLSWRHGLYINFVFKNSLSKKTIIKFFKNFGFII